jgi:hypothetical protein
VQTPELHHYEKQADDPGQVGFQKILPVLSDAYVTQGDKVARFAAAVTVVAAFIRKILLSHDKCTGQ